MGIVGGDGDEIFKLRVNLRSEGEGVRDTAMNCPVYDTKGCVHSEAQQSQISVQRGAIAPVYNEFILYACIQGMQSMPPMPSSRARL